MSRCYWLPRLPPLPWRLAARRPSWSSRSSVAGRGRRSPLLAIAFAVFWIPERSGAWVLPVVAIALAVLYPFYLDEDVHDPGVRRVAGRRDGRRDARLHHDGRRAEHRRRLRGAARPRLRRVLRDGRVHRRVVRRRSSSREVPARLRTSAPSGIDSRTAGGIHVSIWLLLAARRRRHRALRDHDRPADAAAARRLPRDRDARLRRDPAADRAQRRQPLRHRLQPDERPERDHAARRARAGGTALRRDRRLPARELPAVLQRELLGHQIQSTDVFFWTAARAAADHRLLLAAAARLAARPRVGRDPRGRDRGGRDGHAADADEDVGVRDAARSSAASPARTTRASRARRSPATSSSTSRCSSSAW